MTAPTFRLDDDGVHVSWWHDCMSYLGDGGALVPMRARTRLPLRDSGWDLVMSDPLTLTPSILCDRCKTHGFITNGEWVGA